MDTVIARLTDLVDGLNPLLQFLAVFAIGLVPFLESYVGALVGTVTGVPVVLAVLAAIAGNLVAIAVAVWAGTAAGRGLAARRSRPLSPRRQRVLARVDRYGVPVASLLAPTVMATPITTFVMLTAGLDRRQVIVWQVVAVVAWGVAFAAIGAGLLTALN